MKILLLSNTGQVGWELERALQPLGLIIALDYKPLMVIGVFGGALLVIGMGFECIDWAVCQTFFGISC